MNDRQNLISLLRKIGYERMPVDFSMTRDIQRRFFDYVKSKKYSFPASPFFRLPGSTQLNNIPVERFKAFYEVDLAPGTNIDRLGVAMEPGSEACMHLRRMHHPLKNAQTLKDLKEYPFPVFADKPSKQQIAAVREAHLRGKFALGEMQCSIWESAWYIRSMEAIMMDMLADGDMADYLLDKITDMAVIQTKNHAMAGADGIFLGDDIGMQKTIMMSEELYCRYLKPRLKRIIDEAKKIKPDIIIFYHSCGYVLPFIPHLIDAGIDVLNPVQPECMDFKDVFREYSNYLSFHGVLGTQSHMPFGTPAEIKEYINETLDFVGPQGGLMIAPTHVLEPEVPVQNIVAYIEACRAYRP